MRGFCGWGGRLAGRPGAEEKGMAVGSVAPVGRGRVGGDAGSVALGPSC